MRLMDGWMDWQMEIRDMCDMCVTEWLTSWQYCSTPSLVPTQLLVPDGSGSQRPVWMLTCMLSLPQNIATCGSATANPVPALAASACRKIEQERKKWGLMQSIIIQPIKAEDYCGWRTWDKVCPTHFTHKLCYERDVRAFCEVWTHKVGSAHVLQWITVLDVMEQHQNSLSTLGCYCDSMLQCWENRGAQTGDKLNAPLECLARLMVKRVQVWLDLCTWFFALMPIEWLRGCTLRAVRHVSQTRAFLVEGRALLI